MAENPYYRGSVSDHFDGLRFFYPGGAPDKSLGDVWRMMRDGREGRVAWPTNPPTLPCPVCRSVLSWQHTWIA